MVQRILRLSEVEDATGYGKSTIYAKVAAGDFPKPIPLGARAVGWLETEIAEWQRTRIEARDTGAPS